ncbi:MAG: long-chain fatty acid--CoA ligase [candidate division KSB1 bacterium]|nr:long-chain fatty acid--CoA ligase [candidate division KSB1 bacterium]MDZ7305226.1 long-chain fatty acid--CoA ligase [candidate division KSB1 bacterium]MDZ7314337.1 long-chain fatty acid--CoA ligase [candidate division KSB1 bacterium]
MKHQSVYELLHEVSTAHPDKVAYRYKTNGEWKTVTWREQAETCKKISKSLMALGVKKGDRVGILSQTRLEWVQCDFGISNCGGITVGIYPTNLAPDSAYLINHSDAEVIFVENQDQLDKVQQVRKETPKLRIIITFDRTNSADGSVLNFADFLTKGASVADADFYARAQAIRPDDLMALVYTSGTTGVPRGAMITHENMLFTSDSAVQCLYLQPHFETLLFLPLAHVFARLLVYFSLQRAMTVAFAESIEKVMDNLKEIRPHFITAVPRIFEKIYEKITTSVQDAGGIKEKLFNWALRVGYQVSRQQQNKQPIPGGLKFKHRLANKLVLHKIQELFGGRLVWAVSGAAPLNKNIAEFFHACGILILEGIGMTENTSFSNVNRYEHNKFGTVGPVGPGIEMKISADGEILFRGKNVMKGYFKDPAATAEAIDQDGWLHSGDVGEIDADGFLKITDRKKELIITSGGKNIAPQRIERILRTSRFISQAMAYGDRRKYVTALVTLNREQIELWAKEHGLVYQSYEELVNHPEVKKLIEAEVNKKNAELASFETVKKVAILPEDFSIGAGDLTPTLKIKRQVVTEKYRKLLEQLYLSEDTEDA